MKRIILFLSVTLFLISCDKKGLDDLKLISKKGNYNAIIEIGAGTSLPYEYSKESKSFRNRVEKGIEQRINYLPPPFNFGFFPNTFDKNTKNNIDIIVLTQSYSTGTLIDVNPIALISAKKNNKQSNIVITIPFDEEIKVVGAKDLQELTNNYKGLTDIIKIWLEANNYSEVEFLDLDSALNFINSNKL